MSDHCGSCGVEWKDHLGIAGTCAKATAAEARAKRLEQALKPLLFAVRRWAWDDDDRCVCCRVRRGEPHKEKCYAHHVVEQARKAMEE